MIHLLMLALLMSPDIDPPPKYKAWIQDHEVWMETDGGPRRVTYDALAVEPAAVSPVGDKVAYVVANPAFDNSADPHFRFVNLVSSSGQFMRKITLDEVLQSFSGLDWIDNRRLGVMLCGHANCVYWVVDVDTGATVRKFFGGFDFLWSHDREYVARRGLGSVTIAGKDGMIETDELSYLMLNDDGKDVYPPLNPKTQRRYDRVLGYLAWSPNDEWISFPETECPSGDGYVVLVSPQGEVLRESLPVDVEYNAKIEWTDDNHFQITTSKRTFKFVVDGDEMHAIVEHTK